MTHHSAVHSTNCRPDRLWVFVRILFCLFLPWFNKSRVYFIHIFKTIFTVTDKETDTQLNEWRPKGHNGGTWGHRSGVPFLLQPFQLSPSTPVTIYEHDLPTLQLLHSALGANLSHPPATSNQPQVPPWPSDPQHITHLGKTNLMSHMQNYICIMYVLIWEQMHTHTHSPTQDQVPCVHTEGSVVIL